MDVTSVTLVNDDKNPATATVDTSATATFQYNLNEEKTRKKLLDGAMRTPYQREEKIGCTNLIFNDGAFNAVVLKAIVEIKNGPKHFIVGKEDVEKVTVDPRKELSGKHVDTKVEFKVNGHKIVIHVYNSKQKLTIQGKKYKWFVDSYLEPFLKMRIRNSMPQIDQINESIMSSLQPQMEEQDEPTDTLTEEAEIMNCDRCTFVTKDAKF